MEFKHFCENCGSHSSYQMPKVERLREKTFVERNNDLCCKFELGGFNFQPKLLGGGGVTKTYSFSNVSLLFLLILFKDFSIPT